MSEGIMWCNTHHRQATHVDHKGMHVCDPRLGGIMMPCHVVLAPVKLVEEDSGQDTASSGNTKTDGFHWCNTHKRKATGQDRYGPCCSSIVDHANSKRVCQTVYVPEYATICEPMPTCDKPMPKLNEVNLDDVHLGCKVTDKILEASVLEMRMTILAWVHDNALDQCDTVSEARDVIMGEIYRLDDLKQEALKP